jgi:hypothetical protein
VIRRGDPPVVLSWRRPLEEAREDLAVAVAPDETIYITQLDSSTLYAVNKAGQELWRYSFPLNQVIFGKAYPTSSGGPVYVFTEDYKIQAVSAEGKLLGSHPFKEIATSKYYHFFPSLNGDFYLWMELKDETVAGYRMKPDGSVTVFPWPEDFIDSFEDYLIDLRPEALLVFDSQGNSFWPLSGGIIELSPEGKVISRCDLGSGLTGNLQIAADSTVFYLTRDGRVGALKSDCGQLWQAEIKNEEVNPSYKLELRGEALYASNERGDLFAFNAADGKQLWQRKILDDEELDSYARWTVSGNRFTYVADVENQIIVFDGEKRCGLLEYPLPKMTPMRDLIVPNVLHSFSDGSLLVVYDHQMFFFAPKPGAMEGN